ncbi:GlsB/YeaQ/YmgE family stress response membrane protein [Candidatus Saccharibacteria bacterium]|nr:GlsB/YeaQ/YmgE family stress response membrane protein [Candidatus Saccharibacteria bacterium]
MTHSIVGALGGVAGGFIIHELSGAGLAVFRPAGLLVAGLGAVLLVGIYEFIVRLD